MNRARRGTRRATDRLPPATQTGSYPIDPAFAYKRRNCRIVPGHDAPGGICALPTSRTLGTDTNRNYGALWGGPARTCRCR